MGLDMHMYAVTNLNDGQLGKIDAIAEREKRPVRRDELRDLGISWCEAGPLADELAPYATKLTALFEVYDEDAVRLAFGVPADAVNVGGAYGGGKVAWSYAGPEPGERYSVEFDEGDYIVWEERELYCYNSHETGYWRKEYGLEDFIYGIHGDVENTKMCHLTHGMYAEVFKEAKRLGLRTPMLLHESEEAFYWEWY